MIIEPGADQVLVVDRKAQGLDQMQRASRVGAETNGVARVGRNFGMNENDVKHGESLKPQEKTTARV